MLTRQAHHRQCLESVCVAGIFGFEPNLGDSKSPVLTANTISQQMTLAAFGFIFNMSLIAVSSQYWRSRRESNPHYTV